MFFSRQIFGFPQCFCAVVRKRLGLQDDFGAFNALLERGLSRAGRGQDSSRKRHFWISG